ncbi:unnamed protein product [Hermetia illucens]|uniref:Major facilitator superfamily (MFS) profile domain-containing protein n=1 Tax=Hermetia illucens TaxID=343691 RepID=A0A7R8Z0E9_HERIL|nr:facilitated trehalose transporter Tret1-like [Hermetia illucens]CAD7088651.1 unnamed protein product [Hermetia illucens]
MPKSGSKYQQYATLCVNLLTICYGAFVGWSSAAFLLFQSEDSPLDGGPLSTAEVSWVGSILCVGGLLGTFLFGWMSDRFGRKKSLLFAVIPQLLSWLFIVVGNSFFYLMISRIMGGICAGAIFILVPIYVHEIAQDRIRGALGTFFSFSCNIGILTAYVLGNYMSYNTSPYIFIGVTVLYFVLLLFLPESPIYLMKRQKEQKAEHSLRYFRNMRKISQPPDFFKDEIEKLRNDYIDGNTKGEEPPLDWKDLSNPVARRVIIIGVSLMALNQFCGCFAIISYTATLFEQSGSSLSPNVSTIIVGILLLVGAYVSTVLVDRAGRRLLLSLSAVGTGVGEACLGLYLYCKILGYNVEAVNWLPIVSISFVIFVASLGVLTLPFVVLAEIAPPKIRGVAVSLCMITFWIFAFLSIKYVPIMMVFLGLHSCMFIFAACCFVGAAFILFYVPETKGKSLEAILASFEGRAPELVELK